MDFSGTNSLNMKPFLGGYPFQGELKLYYTFFPLYTNDQHQSKTTDVWRSIATIFVILDIHNHRKLFHQTGKFENLQNQHSIARSA